MQGTTKFPKFLNVDLEIRSRSKLDRIAGDLADRVLVLYHGTAQSMNFLAVETRRCFKSPDAAINELCDLIESLSPGSRRQWNRANRVFDIGYEIPRDRNVPLMKLRPGTLARIARLGGSLAVTGYFKQAAVAR